MTALRQCLEVVRYPAGQVLATPDDPGDSLYFVTSGRLGLTSCGSRESPHREVIPAGGWVGLDALLLDLPRPATVAVVEDCELARLPRRGVDELLEQTLREVLATGQEPEDAPPAAAHARASGELSSPAVGLSLSGGGAKCIAHVGVLGALAETGIPIDRVAGTSGGALFGALWCAGMSIDEIARFAHSLGDLVRRRSGLWDDMDPVSVGLIRGERTWRLYDELLGGITFSALRVPLEVVATNLVTGEPVFVRDGNVAAAVRASMGVPGVYAPWPCRGRYLVDGGLVLPEPVSAPLMHQAGVLISSQVVTSRDDLLVGLPTIGKRSHVGLIVARANAILARHVAASPSRAGILRIVPPVQDFDVLDYAFADELIAIGADAARFCLPMIEAAL